MSAIAQSPTIEVLSSTDEILDRVPVVAGDHDYTVIDGPAGLSELTRTILLRADLALSTVQTDRGRCAQRCRYRAAN